MLILPCLLLLLLRLTIQEELLRSYPESTNVMKHFDPYSLDLPEKLDFAACRRVVDGAYTGVFEIQSTNSSMFRVYLDVARIPSVRKVQQCWVRTKGKGIDVGIYEFKFDFTADSACSGMVTNLRNANILNGGDTTLLLRVAERMPALSMTHEKSTGWFASWSTYENISKLYKHLKYFDIEHKCPSGDMPSPPTPHGLYCAPLDQVTVNALENHRFSTILGNGLLVFDYEAGDGQFWLRKLTFKARDLLELHSEFVTPKTRWLPEAKGNLRVELGSISASQLGSLTVAYSVTVGQAHTITFDDSQGAIVTLYASRASCGEFGTLRTVGDSLLNLPDFGAPDLPVAVPPIPRRRWIVVAGLLGLLLLLSALSNCRCARRREKALLLEPGVILVKNV